MSGKGQILEITISQLDWYLINQVKKLRKQKGISQADLSVKMGFSEKLVGSIENPTLSARYNVSHINLLAKALNCNIHDLLPVKAFSADFLKLKVKRTHKLSRDGKPSKKTVLEVIDIIPLNN
ncbi:helix-turn-helix transcriptional regulator [Chryseolinea lacunae]|uniref:Helix-turn-helix transcriptional regulator n=1 Tax=Chryseolinea lacunae TaxID=2801331 RepID=A0ABS1KNP3_9BACT|nr:helix-turn-helix transcriptional regulator [Chryseolinea lacunae]MBL0741075.1 helix-turn-helix transcriptional regulator [Chryseolinea lacunae]